jgi:arylsulfatase A-like enzyme
VKGQESKAKPGTVGFILGFAIALFVTIAVAVGYNDLGVNDRICFLVFIAASSTALLSAIIGLNCLAFATLLGTDRREIGVAIGAVLGSALILVVEWHMMLRLADLDLFDRRSVLAFVFVWIGALALGGLAYLISRLPPGRLRGGWAATTLCALVAVAVFATRSRSYEAPMPLPRQSASSVASPLRGEATNVLLISIDTLRADHLPTYGYSRQTAPVLSELSRRGVVFENAHTQRTFTAPALATILTGTYPPTHRVLNNRDYLQDFNETLAEILQARGYHTVSRLTNPGLTSIFNYSQGFDDFQGTASDAEVARHEQAESSRELNELVLAALDELGSETIQPFFFWIHYLDPHAPYVVPEGYRELYLDDDLADAHGEHPSPTENAFLDFFGTDEFYSNRELDFAIAQYDAEIRFNDESIGDVFDKLTEYDLWKNTLIVVTSDHGEALGEHRTYFKHGVIYDHNTHVPLIFFHPKLPAGLRIERAVGLVDVLPTILDLLGLPPSPMAQGQSLAPLILDQGGVEMRSYHFSIASVRNGYQTNGVRSDTHRLVFDVDQRWVPIDVIVEHAARLWVPEDNYNVYRYRHIERELYDLVNDPKELRNLANLDPAIQARLEDVLWKWIESAYHEGRNRAIVRAEIPPEVEEALQALGYVE